MTLGWGTSHWLRPEVPKQHRPRQDLLELPLEICYFSKLLCNFDIGVTWIWSTAEIYTAVVKYCITMYNCKFPHFRLHSYFRMTCVCQTLMLSMPTSTTNDDKQRSLHLPKSRHCAESLCRALHCWRWLLTWHIAVPSPVASAAQHVWAETTGHLIPCERCPKLRGPKFSTLLSL